MTTPAHYAGKVTPWDLERCMRTSGSVFVDARRTDAIEYLFRIKGTREDQIRDLQKARHCIDAALEAMNAAVRDAEDGSHTQRGARPRSL